jgi:protein TonB
MGHTTQRESTAGTTAVVDVRPRPQLSFELLVLADHKPAGARRGATLVASVVLHSALIAAIVIVPLLIGEALPAPPDMIRAFFVSPPDAPAPPPPPPPPPAAARTRAQAPTPAPVPSTPAQFTAPIEVPEAIAPEPAGIDLGVEGGVPGGVEGGVPGGVVGGIVGGLPQEAPPPAKVVRIGGRLVAPKLIRMIPPVYPDLALASRLTALVTLEAHVDTRGRVISVKVLQGHPLFDEAAMAAVREWRYQPLLLNGVPTEFLVSVTVRFNLTPTGQR